MRATAIGRRSLVKAMPSPSISSASVTALETGHAASDLLTEQSIDRLLKAAQARSTDAVAVAGPAAGAAMCALWRRGFERVEAARRVTCACADQLSDILLVLGCETTDKTVEVVSAVLPILRHGGVLAVDASRFRREERARLCRMLGHRGLRYSETAHLKTEIVAYRPETIEFSLAS
jgi:hypothetical protein